MEEDFNHILLFKTSISNEEEKQFLYALLDHQSGVEQWNIDLDDEDKVLRIISFRLSHQHIIDLIVAQGHDCCKLL